MALPDASAGDDVLAGDLADIFGIDLDPADSGAAAARQGTTGRRRPRRGRPRRPRAASQRYTVDADTRSRPANSGTENPPWWRSSATRRPVGWNPDGGAPVPLALRAGQEDALQVLYREIEKRQTE